MKKYLLIALLAVAPSVQALDLSGCDVDNWIVIVKSGNKQKSYDCICSDCGSFVRIRARVLNRILNGKRFNKECNTCLFWTAYNNIILEAIEWKK